MPTIGGASGIGWDENAPADTESAGLGDDRIRSLKSSLRQGLDSEHNWPSAGGSNIGCHALGSARPYVGTQSQVSSSGSDGRIMWTSDTSRQFHVGSGGTSLIGGATAILATDYPSGTAPQRHFWSEEWGIGVTGSGGSVLVTIPNSGYSGLPIIQVTHRVTDNAAAATLLSVLPADAASFVVRSIINGGVTFLPGQLFYWRSVGTRAL